MFLEKLCLFVDIRLDWRVYNYLQSDARKLLNFYIWFGEPFPVDKGQLQLQSRSSVYNKRSSKVRKMLKNKQKHTLYTSKKNLCCFSNKFWFKSSLQ